MVLNYGKKFVMLQKPLKVIAILIFYIDLERNAGGAQNNNCMYRAGDSMVYGA